MKNQIRIEVARACARTVEIGKENIYGEPRLGGTIFTLSKIKPIDKLKIYNVTHKSSAVNRKCNAVLIFITNTVSIKKKMNRIKFTSPITINLNQFSTMLCDILWYYFYSNRVFV